MKSVIAIYVKHFKNTEKNYQPRGFGQALFSIQITTASAVNLKRGYSVELTIFRPICLL